MEIIKLPKDAVGRDIPRSTGVMYDANGKKLRITSFTYRCDVQGLWAQWKVFSPDIKGEDGMLPANSLYLDPPDSWEKLDEDLSRIARSALERKTWTCAYFNRTPMKCYGCRADKCFGHCDGYVMDSIRSRILKLRGEDK